MNPADYPDYGRYVALLARRDQGLMLSILIAGLALAYLVAFRRFWPWRLHIICRTLTAIYFVSLAVFVVWSLTRP